MEEREEGFTLIELLVVIIIIGILAAIAIPVFLSQRKKGYDAQAKSDLRNLATLEETYFTDNNNYAIFADKTAAVAALTDYKPSSNVTAVVGVGYDSATPQAKAATAAASTGGFCIEATSSSNNTFVYDSTKGGLLGQKSATVKCP